MNNNQSRLTSVKLGTRVILSLAVVSMIFSSCSDDMLELRKNGTQAFQQTETSTETTTSATSQPVDCSSCKFVVPPGMYPIDGYKLGIQPGDVICLDATKQYGSIRFTNIVGTADNPVIIRACGGPSVSVSTSASSSYAIKVDNSKYFRITGGDTEGSYGIKIKGGNIGLQLTYLSTNFEVDHVEVSNVGFAGIMAKTDPSCDDATIRGNFTMTDVFVHDNYVHDTGGEGLYIGNSFYNGGVNTSCGLRYPGELKNIKIYKNHVVNSGWESIQLGCAVSGAEVYDNVVENYGVANVNSQNNGIQIGEGTGGLCYNNYVKGGKGTGIIVLGLGDNTVYNNIIVNPGGFGIFCDDRYSPGSGFKFLNNTIVNPASDGIRIYADLPNLNNVIQNNLIANPGSYTSYSYPRSGNDSYVYVLNSSVKLTISNNWYTRATLLANYLNLGSFSDAILINCPLVDRGTNLSSRGVTNDFLKTNRPRGLSHDIGAVEYR